jgi:peptidoglycan L-alanyl-D-glutamate endopeptidase CwlK
MPRDNDRSHLHPVLREKLVALDSALMAKGVPLTLYEGARSPFRQAELYAQGRGAGTPGHTFTKAKAWTSYHQFGCAVDYVFRINGAWTWSEPSHGMWADYTKLADAVGLRSLSFERPHVELPLAITSLQRGVYPPGGDSTWHDWIEVQIEAWGSEARTIGGITHPAAPPMFIERPALVA